MKCVSPFTCDVELMLHTFLIICSMKLKVVIRWAYQEGHTELKRTVPQNHILSKLQNSTLKVENCTIDHMICQQLCL